MKAAVLVKNGSADKAFEIRTVEKPTPKENEVLIKVEGFGLNFADIMARQGLYQDCPPLPAIIGYDVVGHIVDVGKNITHLAIGDRVTALTRFGGYAEYAVANSLACAKIDQDYPLGKATALTTQYCTAYYCFHEMMTLRPKNQVLIHAAAGGVGTALVQLAVHNNCIVFGTAGSEEKLNYIKNLGVHYPINYRAEDFYKKIVKILNQKGLDAIFDPVGGTSAKKGYKLLGAGGRLLLFGASSLSGASNFSKIKQLIGFGFYHPIQFMMSSKSILGVNMLRIADYRPEVIQHCLQEVIKGTKNNYLDPTIAKVFSIDELADAHTYLEDRKSIGKVSIKW